MHWANVALANRTMWTDDSYTNRVNGVYKLRAAIAQDTWRVSEEAWQANPQEATEAAANKRRERTQVVAREWFGFATQTSQDASIASQLCQLTGASDTCQ
jgi:hypothetical protein